jgi:uncharacterized protein YceH (UPF0502 family)
MHKRVRRFDRGPNTMHAVPVKSGREKLSRFAEVAETEKKLKFLLMRAGGRGREREGRREGENGNE